ncbi:MAG: hypothetical protein JWQ90_2550 [Hydrocarboniphaga sp.]|uniref:hypothetical protein n=1 Tax=Hydrocarboniphaga sp. TaxID=2033016 RepID=UPI002611C4E9|nr:hypothetical protein [Hydrocarboniphaga sp.]MDB5970100.1 hypothetical protein [Hydrocarboniphaga sp.]
MTLQLFDVSHLVDPLTDPLPLAPIFTAGFTPCVKCGGYGLVDNGDAFEVCQRCNGDGAET